MKEISFSIIVPIFNRESCVQLAIDSICRQDYSNWELILVDDGSTDGTGTVCSEYAKKDARILYHYKKNGGVSSARNLGIQLARGEYILFLDSDDSMAENCLSALDARINEYRLKPDMLCFGTGSALKQWKPTGNEQGEYVSQETIRELYLPTHINIYPQNQHFLLNYIWNKCYRTDFIKKYGLSFDENRRTWEDGLFVVNCLDKASDILLIPEVLHNGCADSSVDHLSGKFFESQIARYIQDEMNFKVRFEHEFDFTSEHYCHANLSTLNTLFLKAVSACGRRSKPLMEDAAKSPLVLHWVSNVDPNNSYERFICGCVLHKNYHWIYHFYQLNSIRKNIFCRFYR